MRLLVLCFLFVLGQIQVSAQEMSPAAQMLQERGGTLTDLGVVHGLQSYLVHKDGRDSVVYITPDGLGVLQGKLNNADGNVTKWQLLQVARSRAESIEELPAVDGLHIGFDGPVLVAFVSPTCPHCRKFWEDVGPQIREGRLQVITLPVPSGGSQQQVDTSIEIAARLMDQEHGEAAFVNYSLGRIDVPATESSEQSRQRIINNIDLFQRFEFTQTPAFIGQIADNTLVKAEGWPIELRNLLPEYNPRK